VLFLAAAWAATEQQGAGPSSFRALMDAAMARMHRGMMVPYTGDPDRDFAAMMIPHHQGAIEMAEAELRYGHNERLRRLAQEILVTQQQEIAVMRQILSQFPPATEGAAPLPTDPHSRQEQ